MMSTFNQEQSHVLAGRLARGFWLLSGIVIGLITLGATVRANNAGLACPDWPLCFGDVIPQFDSKVALEWGHRVLAGTVSLGLVFLSVVIFKAPKLRERLRVQVSIVWLLLLTQIVFGGLTVLLQLAPWSVTVHLLLGNSFCLGLLWIALDLRDFAQPPRESHPIARGVRVLCTLCAGAMALQILLGGWVSSHYAGLACLSFPTCDGIHYAPTLRGPVGMHVLHRFNGLLVLACFAALAVTTRKIPRIGRLARWALGSVVVQIIIGIANVLGDLPVGLTVAHTAVATAIVLTTTLLLREIVHSPAASPIERVAADLGIGKTA
jgi:cytochrome c oxidase assembly protein subunit 15